MSEKVIVRQTQDYQIEFQAVHPDQPDPGDFQSVHALHEITPYGMMLVSLATCTGQVVLSYANHHGLNLQEVELRVEYDRIYKDDCDNCQQIEQYVEIISEEIRFTGDLSQEERKKLFRIAHQCPIKKIFQDGIKIEAELI